MSNYTTQAKVQDYLGENIPSSIASATLASWLLAVDTYIENYTNESWKDLTADTRYYDGDGGTELYIDNFEGTPAEVTTLDQDGDDDQTLTINEDYRVYPWNDNPNKTVKNRLVLIAGNNRIGYWPKGERRIKVTADYGMTTAPADIVLVATKLMGNVLQKNMKGGPTTMEKVGDVQFQYATIDESAVAMGITNILDSYRVPVL
jgi:hypothetical protein